jgi:RNA polymerase sigma factor (TIGR02999 family)
MAALFNPPDSGEITALLAQWRTGDPHAAQRLVPIIYGELRALADRYLRRERADHTLQATALAHEAYVRLVGQHATWENRAHFFGVAAALMRRILVDHARRKRAGKRGGPQPRVPLDERIDIDDQRSVELIALDDALKSLAGLDPQHARIVELRFFTGLTFDEIAAVLGVSESTVKREWRLARAWLERELSAAL